jgi:hypothetical protein
MVIVSIGYELQAWVRANNSCATKRMVGRDSGLSSTHCKATQMPIYSIFEGF